MRKNLPSIRRYSLQHSIILDKFLLPNHQTSTKSLEKPANEKVVSLINNFHIPKSSPLLPLRKPDSVPETPFEFYSLHNDDQSHIDLPRLSVTKLLTRNWCELREFYEVFAGSISTPPSYPMKVGMAHHTRLENETHQLKDMLPLLELLESHNPLKTSPECNLAYDWLDKIFNRIYSLVCYSDAREVLVHGYLDLDRGKYAGPETNVLVSGVIDHLELKHHDREGLDMFDELQHARGPGPVDIPLFLHLAHEILSKYKNEYNLEVSDIKTRTTPSIPQQQSVVDGAKFQVMHYNKMVKTMSSDPDLCYRMFLENAKIRCMDVDAPIDPNHAIVLLVNHYDLVYHDFIRLSKGEMEEEGTPTFSEGTTPYSLGLLQDAEKEINELTTAEYNVDITEAAKVLSRPWKTPLTLRYFAKRSSQMMHLLHHFQTSLAVEYHHAKSGQVIERIEFPYDDNLLTEQVLQSSQFWKADNTFQPAATTDLAKCKYCDFKARCSVPNLGKKTNRQKSIGATIDEFLRDEC